MTKRRCPHCHKSFYPARCHPAQTVCGDIVCQRERRSRYRRRKIAKDAKYREACRESARQWRKEHPEYWKQYREAHPGAVERNRQQQGHRKRKQHLKRLANNISALDLKPCPATVWVVGGQLQDLANNTSASAQIWVLEGLPPPVPSVQPTCKQHLSGGVSVFAG